MNGSEYRIMLRFYAPDITDEDIVRLARFVPQPTPMALAVFRAYPPKDRLQ